MDHMESSSIGDVKTSNEDTKEAGTNFAAENITITHVDNPGEVSMDCHDESTLLEDVKVCDICGDAGREDLLATCSKCTDGAEHIYCMRIRLEKVPDTDWICEDCVLSEFQDHRRETRCSNFAASLKHNKDELEQEVEASGASKVKANPVCDSKVLHIDKNRREKFSFQPSFKRPLGNVQSALLMRRRALGLDNVLTSRQYNKAPKSQEVSAKSIHELSLTKDRLSTRHNADMLTLSSQIFPKSQQLPTSSGLLSKSKSFNGSDRRRKVQFLEKGPEKQKFLHETAVGTKGKSCAFRSLKKSLSFNDGSAGRIYALDAERKTITPKHFVVSDTKRLRALKGCGSAEMEVKPVLKKPRILSPGGLSFVSSVEKKFGTHCEPISTNFSGTKGSDIKTSQNLIKSGTSSADEKKSSAKSKPSQEQRNKGEVTLSSLLSFRGHQSCFNATGQAKLPAVERSSHQNPKAPQSSHSRFNDGCTSDGTEIILNHNPVTALHTMNCQTDDNSSVSANDMGIDKDLNRSGGELATFPLYYHLNADGSLAIPLFDYLWKGEFQVHCNQMLPGVLCRIQAHLSTQSSPRIPEVAKKFSGKILLEEVPRMSAWPIQFLKDQPQDDSIGLYFFAQDIESYSKYKSFLQCMIDYDLALKGNFDGIELLIFSSNLLPEKCQCWNKLLFLWGIFKQRKFVAT